MIEGKGGITAEVVADSIANDVRLTTLSLSYPRFIHAEFMTHRMFSRNASSSRAIPIDKMNHNIANGPAHPVHWGCNQAGMQAHSRLPTSEELAARELWREACTNALRSSTEMADIGVHKQIVNRLTEPFQFIKVVVTATEWDNFFALRLHPDAQPEIQELARVMKMAMNASTPRDLGPGDWHVPFVNQGYLPAWNKESFDAIKCAVARCARVSYMNHDGTSPDLSKDIQLHDMLLEAGHMSPFEHVATPMQLIPGPLDKLDCGITHYDRHGNAWSGNFRGWIQYRQVL